jgi:hypothetical protein
MPAAFCLFLLTSPSSAPAQGSYSLLDIQDGSALPGSFGVLDVYLSNAEGLNSIGYTLTFDPAVMQNIALVRGDDIEGFEEWTTERNTDWIRVAGSTTRAPVLADYAMVGRLIFTVSAGAERGEAVDLILDDAYGSAGFEVRADVGRFVVAAPVEEGTRKLELEVTPSDPLPGDQVELRMWLNHTPKLSHFQVFLNFPEGTLEPNGEIGGTLVEELGWEGYYISPRPGVDPSTLVTVFGATAPQPAPSGRFLVATVPFVVGRNWGGAGEFNVTVSDNIILGDVTHGDRYYYVEANEVTIRRSRADFNMDGKVNSLDLFEFMENWYRSAETP